MARVTIEDCLQHVDNRFDLVIKAAERAHKLERGVVDPKVPVDKDKPTVIALREIAAGHNISEVLIPHPQEEEVSLSAFTSAEASADDLSV